MPQAARPSSSSDGVAFAAATSGAVAFASPSASPDVASLQALKSEILALRQENAVLKGEVEGLKKQVGQIMAYIRQRAKS